MLSPPHPPLQLLVLYYSIIVSLVIVKTDLIPIRAKGQVKNSFNLIECVLYFNGACINMQLETAIIGVKLSGELTTWESKYP